MAEATILVADDDAAIRKVLSQALGRVGYNVRTTSNAATLWRWVQGGDGDLVITDVVMPDEDGLELLPRIRKMRPEMPVIAPAAISTLYSPSPVSAEAISNSIVSASTTVRLAADTPSTVRSSAVSDVNRMASEKSTR